MTTRTEATNTDTMADKRSFPRISSRCVVDYRPVGDDPAFQQMQGAQGVMQNISGGGVCVRMTEDPGKGNLLAMNIQLPGFPSSVISLGKVCWSKPAEDGFDIGVEFWWVGWQDAGAQEQIRQFIAARLDDESEDGED